MVAETAIPYACSEKANAALGWIDWIVSVKLPLNFCENELIRKYAGLSPISKAMLKKNIAALVALVDESLYKSSPTELYADDDDEYLGFVAAHINSTG
ncbi:hypothetical protein PF002_g6194 [Phytophthora fragariae]|uniref:Uncharacterized protein n=1 Tax=Phytophthora fragariae TaxID=53985 RepID=A0A6A4A1S5_9STRA|nr:hypothetical protein PF002_g6194 [Phytophthora fragariae]